MQRRTWTDRTTTMTREKLSIEFKKNLDSGDVGFVFFFLLVGHHLFPFLVYLLPTWEGCISQSLKQNRGQLYVHGRKQSGFCCMKPQNQMSLESDPLYTKTVAIFTGQTHNPVWIKGTGFSWNRRRIPNWNIIGEGSQTHLPSPDDHRVRSNTIRWVIPSRVAHVHKSTSFFPEDNPLNTPKKVTHIKLTVEEIVLVHTLCCVTKVLTKKESKSL